MLDRQFDFGSSPSIKVSFHQLKFDEEDEDWHASITDFMFQPSRRQLN